MSIEMAFALGQLFQTVIIFGSVFLSTRWSEASRDPWDSDWYNKTRKKRGKKQ